MDRKKDKLLYGMLLAPIAPLIAFFFTEYTGLGERFANKPLLLYAVAGLINLGLIRFFYQRYCTRTAAGMVAITFVAVLFLIFFRKHIAI